MGRVVAIANQKGGVGKTTTAINLGACLAELGQRVLLCDVDPQGNATTGLGIAKGEREESMYQVIIEGDPMRDAVLPTAVEGLHIVPSSVDLAGAEVELVTTEHREYRLRTALEPMRPRYDFVILDCPPSLGLMTLNALTAADSVLIPLQCEYYAMEGLAQFTGAVDRVKSSLNQNLSLEGGVLTMFDHRMTLSNQVREEVGKFFGPTLFQAIIPRNIRLAEAPGFGQSIFQYDAKSRGAEAYMAFAREFLSRRGIAQPLNEIETQPRPENVENQS